jgi:hypothetical protein
MIRTAQYLDAYRPLDSSNRLTEPAPIVHTGEVDFFNELLIGSSGEQDQVGRDLMNSIMGTENVDYNMSKRRRVDGRHPKYSY